MTIDPTGLRTPATAKTVSPDRPANIEQAAQSFEALFVGQMLKMVRESNQSSGLGESDNTSAAVFEMADENLAKQITQNGGLGLAKLIAKQFQAGDQRLSDKLETPARTSSS